MPPKFLSKFIDNCLGYPADRQKDKHTMENITSLKKKKKNLFFAQKPNVKMNKHVNKVRKATGRAEAITAGRQQNKQQYLIKQLMK